MTDTYGQIAFTDAVKSVQEIHGSRHSYARTGVGPDRKKQLGREEAAFIAARDNFFLSSVSETGWPYVQYRGGPDGFLKLLDDGTLGFADFCGNRQYITTGNIAGDDRVALLLVDFANSRRLKIFGHMRSVEPTADPVLIARLIDQDYAATHNAVVERSFVIAVEAFDWNCPQHIRPRFTEDEIRVAFAQHDRAARPCGPEIFPKFEV